MICIVITIKLFWSFYLVLLLNIRIKEQMTNNWLNTVNEINRAFQVGLSKSSVQLQNNPKSK